MKKTKRRIVSLMILFIFLGIVDLRKAVSQTTKLKLKLQTNLIPIDTKRCTTKFIEMISAMSGGQIEITAFPVGTLLQKYVVSTSL